MNVVQTSADVIKYVTTQQEVLTVPVTPTILWMVTDTLVMPTHRHSPVRQNLQILTGTMLHHIRRHGMAPHGFLRIAQQHTTLQRQQQRVTLLVIPTIRGTVQLVLQIQRHLPVRKNHQEQFGTLFQVIHRHGTVVRGVLLTAQQHTVRLLQRQHVTISVLQITHGTVQAVSQTRRHLLVPQNLQTRRGTPFQATLKHGMGVHGVLQTVQQVITQQEVQLHVAINVQLLTFGVDRHVLSV